MTSPVESLPTNYRFADLTLDDARRCVTRQGQPIELKALDFDLLRFLVEQAPNVVNADVLAEKVWGRHFVSPENVAQRVMLLRQSLSDDANKPRYIETVRNKGYRLIPIVERVSAEGPVAPQPRWVGSAKGVALLAAVGVAAAATYWLARPTEQLQASPSSVAVLPFENLSPNPEDAYFAASMQDEVVNQLTKIRGLRVFAVRPGAGAPRTIPEVGRDLNVATVLDGSVYHAEGRVRVTPRLTDTTTGASLWSNSYEREQSDILAIQSNIALDVAQALRLELSTAERERVQRLPTTNPQARDLYLMAKARALESDDAFLAIVDIEQALELDPAFKEAWSASSLIRNGAAAIDPEHADQHRQVAEQAARRALELDPEFGDAYRALAYSLLSRNDWIGAEAAFRKAQSLNVPLAEMGSYAFLQLSAGKFGPLPRDIFELARAAEPRTEIYYRFLPFVYEGLGERERASDLYETSMRLFGDNSREALQRQIQRVHWLIGHDELVKARTVPIVDPFNAAMLASLEAPEQALEELHRAFAANGRGNPNGYRDIALWAGHYGDPELALLALHAMNEEGFGGRMAYVWLPQLAPMRRLPEFKAFVREIGMVAYWEAYGWPMAFCRPLGQNDFECT